MKIGILTKTMLGIFVMIHASCVGMDSHLSSSDLSVEIDTNGYLIFSYDENKWARQKQNYELTGIQLHGNGCMGKDCDFVVWEETYDKFLFVGSKSLGPILPRKVRYGDTLDKMKTKVAPKALRYNIHYTMTFGLHAYDDNRISKAILYAAKVHFVIKNDKGQPYLEFMKSASRENIQITDIHSVINFPLYN